MNQPPKKRKLNRVRVISALIVATCLIITFIGLAIDVIPVLQKHLFKEVIKPFFQTFGYWSALLIGITVLACTYLYERISVTIKKTKRQRQSLRNHLPKKDIEKARKS